LQGVPDYESLARRRADRRGPPPAAYSSVAVLRVIAAAGLVAGATVSLAACGASASQESPATRGRPARAGIVLADRARVLTLGVLPNGQGFWITARRYALGGNSAVDLTADLQPATGSQSSIDEAFGSAGGGTLRPNYAHGPLALGELVACARRPVTLVLGMLRSGSGSAVMRYGGHIHAMTRVVIPRELRAGGDLVYGYSSRRLEVVVRSSSGQIVERVAIPGAQTAACLSRSAGSPEK
jgi:hypothetical protein